MLILIVMSFTEEDQSTKQSKSLLALYLPFLPCLAGDMLSFVNQNVRLLKHDRSIVREDHLDTR